MGLTRLPRILAILVALLATSVCRADVTRDVPYCTVDGEDLLLDYDVPDGDGRFPVAIIVHGGGWTGGDKAKDVDALFRPLIDAKIAWVSINYGLAPKHRWP